MAGKIIITELQGNAVIFAPDGSVRQAALYGELKPEEVLVTENGSQALLKQNGEREIRVDANSGFLFETPPESDASISALQRGVEGGEDPTENGESAAGQSTTSSTFFVAGNVSVFSDGGTPLTVSELLEEAEGEEGEEVQELTTEALTTPQLDSLAMLQRLFLERLLAAEEEPTVAQIPTPVAEPSAPTTTQTEETPPETAEDVNQAPTVSLSVEVLTEEAVSVNQLVATISAEDSESDTLSFSLIDNDAGYFDLDGNRVVLTQLGVDAVNNDTLLANSLNITVEVSDGEFSVRASGQVSVNQVNDNVPELTLDAVEVTEDAVTEGMTIATFTASDADGNALAFSLSGNENGYLAVGNGVVTLTSVGVAAVNNDALNLEAIEIFLTVTDGEFETSVSDIAVVNRINDNSPAITITTSDVSETTAVEGQEVAFVSVIDADGDDVTFTLVNNADGYLTLDNGRVALTVEGAAAIHDDALDIRSLTVSVEASDGENTSQASAALIVGRENDNTPELSLAIESLTEESVSEETVVATISVSDDDGDEVSLSLVNNEAGYFRIEGNEVLLTAEGVAAINADSISPLTSIPLSVRAFDGAFNVVASEDISVVRVNDNSPNIELVVSDMTEESVVEGTVVASIIADDADNSTLSFNLVGGNSGWVEIVGNEVRLTAGGVEAINDDAGALTQISFSVEVSDGANISSAQANVVINRVNDNDPVLSITVTDVTEESVSAGDVVATINASDADGDDITYSLSDDNGGKFELVGNEVRLTETGVVAINNDSTQTVGLDFEVSASDGTRSITSTESVSITRVNDNAPEISLSINDLTEEAVNAGDVVATISVSDADGISPSYSLSDTNGDKFELVGNEIRLTEAGVTAINDDSVQTESLSFSVSADDNITTVIESGTVNITRVDDIVANDDSEVSATQAVVTGNVITGENGQGEDNLLNPDTVQLTSVRFNGVDYAVGANGVSIETPSGTLSISQDGNYSYASSIQTEFSASNLSIFEQKTDGVTFYGGEREDALFLSDDPTQGLDLEALLNPSNVEEELEGNNTDDVLDGTNQSDTLYGYGGNDTLTGAQGEDALYGGDGNDSLDGGQGKDYLSGGAGNDTLTGGGSKDVFVYESGHDVITDFKNTNDSIVIKSASTITYAELIAEAEESNGDTILTLDTGTLTLKGVTLDELEASLFTFDSDSAIGGSHHATIYGMDSDVDTVTFTLDGDAEEQSITWYLYSATGQFVESGSTQVDGETLSLSNVDVFHYVVLDVEGVTVETVSASLSEANVTDDIFTYTLSDDDSNSAQANLTIGYDDLLRPVVDVVTAQTAGLNNETSANIATGNLLANDALDGEWSFATIQYDGASYVASAGLMLIETPYGSLTVNDDGSFVYHLMTEVPPVNGLESFTYTLVNNSGMKLESRLDVRLEKNDDEDLSGLINTTELTGDALSNTLAGHDLDDIMSGLDGNDSLYGGAGTDLLDGGLGNDLLIGGQGNDTMTGGLGEDIFRFLSGDATGSAVDVLTDFDVSNDVLDLTDLLDGASAENINDYLVSLTDSDGKATLTVASDGEAQDQVIVVEDKSLEELSNEVLGFGHGSGAEILGKMLEEGALIVHQ